MGLADVSDGHLGGFEAIKSLTPLPGEFGVGKRVHGFLLKVETNLVAKPTVNMGG